MSIEERIEELLEASKEEEIAVNEASLSDLRTLLERPLIFLLDNGNFRIRWNFADVHVAIEIKGDWQAEVVVTKPTK